MNKSTQRRALGRGLTNLIPQDTEESGSDNQIVMVDANAIMSNPFQPRRDFNEEEIAGLSDSIATQGLLQPVTVRRKVDGYEIVSGERRFRACRRLGWDKVPCIVRPKVPDREMLELALVENIQRENLNDIETAVAYQRLLLECSLSHEELAKRVGKSRSALTNSLRLLKLSEPVQEMLRSGGISMGHARALLAVDDPKRQKELAEAVAEKKLSVREIETIIQKNESKNRNQTAKPRKGNDSGHAIDPDIRQKLDELQYRLGTAVRIVGRAQTGGRIVIQFHGTEDLGRILEILAG